MRRLLLAAAFLPLPATAQTDADEQVWVNITVQGSVKDRLVYFAEVQPRFGDGASRLEQLLLRPAIGWKATPRLTLYQGYAHVILPIAGARNRNEERSFQQVSWNAGQVGPGDLSTRTRLEQRWLSDGDDMGLRVRQMIRYRLPLRADRKGVGLLGWTEPFIALNDTDWGARAGFDQLRTFVGAEVPVGGASTAELGYMNQLIDRGGGVRRVNHIASVTVFVRH
jgi:hypothetical protein